MPIDNMITRQACDVNIEEQTKEKQKTSVIIKRAYGYRHAVLVFAIMLIIVGILVCCSMSVLDIGDNFLLVAGLLALGVSSWCAGCCCLKLGFKAITEHKRELEQDANRFRNATLTRTSRNKLIAINDRYSLSYPDHEFKRNKREGGKHVNFSIIVQSETLPPPPRFTDRSISVNVG